MKFFLTVTLSVAVFFTAALPLGAQNSQCRRPELQREIYEENARPKLKLDYSQAVKFKLGSHKSVYGRGEMITLDLAMLNVSGQAIFLHKLWAPYLTLKVRGENGTDATMGTYSTVLEGVVPQSYEYVRKDHLMTETAQILVDCSAKESGGFDKSLKELYQSDLSEAARDRLVFERGLFVTWGDACISVTRPGSYTITAEMSNEFVVSSACEPLVKTAVGTIESTPLKITIEK